MKVWFYGNIFFYILVFLIYEFFYQLFWKSEDGEKSWSSNVCFKIWLLLVCLFVFLLNLFERTSITKYILLIKTDSKNINKYTSLYKNK